MKKVFLIFLLLPIVFAQLDGDINHDNVVDLKDLIAVAKDFGKQGNYDADINNDGEVNLGDLIIVAKNFGKELVIVCGDSDCNGSETCNNCPEDCGQCQPQCGDGQCTGSETCSSCPADCDQCPSGGGKLLFKSGFESNTYIGKNTIKGIDTSGPSGANNWDRLSDYMSWAKYTHFYLEG